MSHSHSLTFSILKLLPLLLLGISIEETTTVVHAQTEQKVVATVNGRTIAQEEVDASIIAQLLPLQEQIYALRKAALDNLIISTLLADEAKKRGITTEELRKQLTGGKVEITPNQVEEEYLANITVFGSMSPDEAKERIRVNLEGQARVQYYREALAKLKENAKLELSLAEPKLPSVDKDDTAPSRGTKEAAITITEFSDFQCPFCLESQSVIAQVLQRYGNDVRLIFRHLPLEIHAQAFSSAQAAVCAGEQGAFWQYHDALFATEKLWPDTFQQIASDLGLNTAKFKACFNSETARAAVLKDVREAKRLGINGTPAFIINGKLVRGTLSFEGFKGIIEQEIKAAQNGARTQ